MKLTAVVASATRSKRSRLAVDVSVSAISNSIAVDVVDLAEVRVSLLDGRAAAEYEDDTARVIERITKADCVIFATPVYRGTYTGAFKNLLDHLSLESLEGKAVGLIATGATAHHYLMIDTQMRSVLAWFNAYILPGSVYLTEKETGSLDALESSGAAEKLKELSRELTGFTKHLPSSPPRPFSLAKFAGPKTSPKG